MELQLFLLTLTFLLYAIVQALIINGIFISASGSDITLPDGTVLGSEMILYPVYKFLNKSYDKAVGYTLTEINNRIKVPLPGITGGTIDWRGDGPLFAVAPNPGQNIDPTSLKVWAAAYLHGALDYDEANQTIMFYQNVTFYRFSKWLRKPILTCIICMASFWSIFTFLIPVILIFGWHWQIIPIWVANMFCLSYLNYVIFKPRK